jgi:DHA1 family inner membrane transport protein
LSRPAAALSWTSTGWVGVLLALAGLGIFWLALRAGRSGG